MGTTHTDVLAVGVPVGALQTGLSVPTPLSTPLVGSGQRAQPDFLINPRARGRITGTVKQKSDPVNLPLSRRVRLYRERDGALMREAWSDAAGVYSFECVEEFEKYTVVAWDYQRLYRAVVADNLQPELMT